MSVRFTLKAFERVPDDGAINEILNVANKVLNPTDREKFIRKLQENKNLLVLVCCIDDQIVGFKAGFEKTADTFYSWLGGVDPDFQRLGAASMMMKAMFEWCAVRGYKMIETKTTNSNKAMLLLNIISGFDIVEVRSDMDGVQKILMTKSLTIPS
jgi:ribosomal protein S18 acetylase RimI-like enzyme